ncbi:TIGR02186 family protein [Paracoccus sp. (in: a-proteobacteria)]|uniref:TIGR02186 family protein n=1 Tax=Paracoccus sp. TaxID=267 RepID=UPI0026DEE1B0|nr:TIGR02186 family protein [Paracoccus sp. (in: a-proteobacteria)]MDO5648193.1 TIGR02186 family protein [Paracoccus sp. (in: a-proteobacteria)]
MRGVVLAYVLMAQAAVAFQTPDGGNFPVYPDPSNPRGQVAEASDGPVEQVVAGLSRDSVAISASFDGSDILIYGAIKRESPIPDGPPLDIIVTLEAPSQPLVIWRKARKLGIWINTERVDVGAAGYYAVATTGPLETILDPAMDARFRISLPQAMHSFAGEVTVDDTLPFTAAMMRIREGQGEYRLDEGAVSLAEQTLFRTDIKLPANLVEGDYKTRIFLLRDGQVVDVYRAPIEVRKVGLERWLYRLAFDQPLIYGLMSLAVAVAAGWGASAAFRQLGRR